MTREQAVEFVRNCARMRIGFHPDTPFEEYVELATGRKTFSDKEVLDLTSKLSEAFAVLKDEIYDIAYKETRLESYKADMPTVVVFRKWRKYGTVIALFPHDYAGGGLINSFEHVGQHGAASYHSVMKLSVPATPEEYAPLKKELESHPYWYRLKVAARAKPRNY